jgi:hypothetical protein
MFRGNNILYLKVAWVAWVVSFGLLYFMALHCSATAAVRDRAEG